MLCFEPHISYIIQSATRSFYGLKTLRAHGLTGKSLKDVTQATLIARIMHGASTSVDGRRRAQNRTVLDCERAGLLACVPYLRRRASTSGYTRQRASASVDYVRLRFRCEWALTLLERAIAKGHSVCLSVRHTCDPHLSGSRY